MRYAHTTCQHAQYTNMRYAVQHALMQAQYACAKRMHTTATWHSPKIKVHDEPTRGFPSITFLEKTFEVAEKPSPLGNTDGRTTPSLPRALGYVASDIKAFGSSQELCAETDWEKLCLLLLIFADLEPLYLFSYINGLAWPISLID